MIELKGFLLHENKQGSNKQTRVLVVEQINSEILKNCCFIFFYIMVSQLIFSRMKR